MNWRITETNQVDRQAIERLGSKFLIGNGFLGIRGTLEEHTCDQKTACIVSGLYDQVGNQWREPVNLPNGLFVQIAVQGMSQLAQAVPLHAQFSPIGSHTQTLDMQRGVHERSTRFLLPDGNTITVQARRFASLDALHLITLEYSVEASADCTITLLTGIDGEVWDLNGPHLREFASDAREGIISLAAFTHEMHVPIAVAECVSITTPTVRREDRRVLREIEVTLTAGQPFTLHKFIAHYTGIDADDPTNEARMHAAHAAQVGFDALLEAHTALWADRWETCDIEIGGDAAAETALRFSMYHLLSIAPAHTERASIPARGLSGQVYKGGIFWDTEIFMLPFFTYTFPHIARNLLMYRYHTLDGARRKAQEYGYRGAFYAWESQDTGDDACTLFNITDVFTNRPMRTYFRDKQVHISADVVYALWDYYTITQDESILLDGGAEVIAECARCLLSYLYYSREKDRYEMLDVTGPDEYHERVDNDAYTSAMTAHTFDVCQRMMAQLAAAHPDYAASLIARLDFAEDLRAIADVRPKLYVPQPDAMSGVIPQFDDYGALEDVSLGDLLLRKLHPYEYLGGGSGLATTTQIIKQGDVVLMMHLFPEMVAPDIKARNWQYYEPRTEHGSSLSACAYALVAAQIGKIDWAYKYFMKTAQIDMLGEGKQYVGSLYIGGTHPAANGGAWMASVFGLCGIRAAEDRISARPCLPDGWTDVRVRMVFRGQKMTVKLTRDEFVIETTSPSAEEILVG
jgi:nigerose phosphorylase